MSGRLKFGSICLPIHAFDASPAVQLERDLQLAEHLDRLGFDELWFGEHHSGGLEIIGAPEVMIAAAAQRTQNIVFGTGVSSLPYHHPLMLLDRMLLLDNLTRGRLIVGLGPGSLAKDARMMGIETLETRRMMQEGVDAIVELLRYEGPVSRKTDWFVMDEAELHLRPYRERLPLRVAQSISPSGPRLAGQYGTGMLSLAAASPEGFEALRTAWSIAEERATQFGTQVNRAEWGVVSFMHLAETEAQAREEVKYGLPAFLKYLEVASFFRIDPSLSLEQAIDLMVTSGIAVIGTPDMAVERIKQIQEQTGGFGTLVVTDHDWAAPVNRDRHYELFATRVIPEFTGHVAERTRAYERSRLEAEMGRGVPEWEAAAAKAQREHDLEQQGRR